jgi:hypothetical protein
MPQRPGVGRHSRSPVLGEHGHLLDLNAPLLAEVSEPCCHAAVLGRRILASVAVFDDVLFDGHAALVEGDIGFGVRLCRTEFGGVCPCLGFLGLLFHRIEPHNGLNQHLVRGVFHLDCRGMSLKGNRLLFSRDEIGAYFIATLAPRHHSNTFCRLNGERILQRRTSSSRVFNVRGKNLIIAMLYQIRFPYPGFDPVAILTFYAKVRMQYPAINTFHLMCSNAKHHNRNEVRHDTAPYCTPSERAFSRIITSSTAL